MQDNDNKHSLMALTSLLVNKLNIAIKTFNLKDIGEVEEIRLLQKKILQLMSLFEKSEEQASLILEQLGTVPTECNDVVYIRNNTKLTAVVSRDIIKPKIRPVEPIDVTCNCAIEINTHFETTVGFILVETEENLRKLDAMLETVIVGVFDHSYRTYIPFSCVIAILIPTGSLFIIDAIKFRHIIPTLRLLKCGVTKIFTSQYDVIRIIEEFGVIGCFNNFNIPINDLYVDWRIRPLNEVLINVISDTMSKASEKINLKLPTEVYIPIIGNEMSRFMSNVNLSDCNLTVVEELIKLREYLAKNNDESAQYVITDNQLYNLILNVPSSIEEFDNLFDKMSAVLRLHVRDFLIILNRTSKTFSLEKLKSKDKKIENETKNRNNNNNVDIYDYDNSQDSSFEISD